jgi:hypothetical protein
MDVILTTLASCAKLTFGGKEEARGRVIVTGRYWSG